MITRSDLIALVDAWLASGKAAAAPVQTTDGGFSFTRLSAASEMALKGYIRPRNSIKEFLFPRHEPILSYQMKGQGVVIADCDVAPPDLLLMGARPCDAAALPVLDKVFNWDCEDEFYTRRRQATTVVTIACTNHDGNCFCTTVGLSPTSDKGSDAILLPIGEDSFEVRTLTDKGVALFAGKTSDSAESAQEYAGPSPKADVAELSKKLADSWDDSVWKEIGLRCLGCGACAYVCPTCHCFDIIDEGNAAGGCRMKNWDSCQFPMFTMHASGHNPRSVQSQRQRQRILHKFRVYPEKFQEILCTGCGNCTRSCPVALGVLTAIELINKD
jgi:ferredoxin